MPYGEESAYAAQAALKKKSPAYKKSSGFKMKSPLKHPHLPKEGKIGHDKNAHNTETGTSVAEGGVALPGNPNYVEPEKEKI